MPRGEGEVRAVPSLLDRLLDDGVDVRRGAAYLFGVRELKQVVARDLEALLNTRQEALDDVPGDFHEAGRSILTYGLPDFSALNLTSHTDRALVRRALEDAIAGFEPRLDRVRVVVEEPGAVDRGLRFRIEAVLLVPPAAEPVTFDAVLQLSTQHYRVDGEP